MKRFFRVVLILLLLAALAAGGWYLYTRYAGKEEGEAVYVTPVSEITGKGYTGLYARYSGVVEARNVVTVDPEKDMTVKECFVKAGDIVQEGTPLFMYDTNSLTLSYEQLLIDIITLENKITKSESDIESYEKKLAKAKKNAKHSYELKITTAELEKKKSVFELEDKQKAAEKVRQALENSTVLSPCAGRIRSVANANGSDPYENMSGDSSGYISLISGSEYCVKGTVSEQSVYTLYTGMPVIIRSRVNERETAAGTIYKIDTEQAVSTPNYYGYAGESASKYAFYVSVPEQNGFIIGQHVILEAGASPEGEAEEGLYLPEYYLVTEESGTFVYAADATAHIEKRAVTTGKYDAERCAWEITAGLALTDALAMPDGTVSVGAKAAAVAYSGAEAE